VRETKPKTGAQFDVDALYLKVASEYGAALNRIAIAYEANPDLRRDLLQEIHLALWRSFEKFAGRCSLQTWIYRVAHNVATSHVIRQRRRNALAFLTLEEVETQANQEEVELCADRHKALSRLLRLIQRLEPIDRQLMLAYLEGMDTNSISEITGMSAANIWTRIHRIKNLLSRRFLTGVGDV
jgi:RNA polymerase sigma-70 factor, ECF subfamily